jgi:hypothetical protein
MPTINKIEIENTVYDLEDTSSEGKFVSLTKEQTVAGTKTFTDSAVLQDGHLSIRSTNITDGTAVSSANYDNTIYFRDSNNDTVGVVRGAFYTTGNQAVQIFSEMPAKTGRNSSAVYNTLTLGLNADATRYVTVTESEP